MNFMSPLKPAWHIERIQALRDGRNIVPTHLQLIISDLCNQNCHFCSYRADDGFSTELFWEGENRNPKRFLPLKKAKEILADYAEMGGEAVQFQGGGEPTVHPDHLKIFGYAQRLGLKTGLVTNGVRLKDRAEFRNFDWIRISLDAGTRETYRKIRESKAWAKVLKNMGLASSWVKPKVSVGFVVTRENYREIPEAVMLVRSLGLDHLRVRAVLSEKESSYYDGIEVDIPDDENIVNNFSIRDFEKPDYGFCGYQQFVLYIGADQCVYTCCTNAYTTHGKIGDLASQTFAKWLASYDRRGWNARSCRHCEFNEINETIDYLMDMEQRDVSFI